MDTGLFRSILGLYSLKDSSISFLPAVTHKMSLDAAKCPLKSKVTSGGELLIWTKGRIVRARELILAPGPLNLYSNAGHRHQEGTCCNTGSFSGQGKI